MSTIVATVYRSSTPIPITYTPIIESTPVLCPVGGTTLTATVSRGNDAFQVQCGDTYAQVGDALSSGPATPGGIDGCVARCVSPCAAIVGDQTSCTYWSSATGYSSVSTIGAFAVWKAAGLNAIAAPTLITSSSSISPATSSTQSSAGVVQPAPSSTTTSQESQASASDPTDTGASTSSGLSTTTSSTGTSSPTHAAAGSGGVSKGTVAGAAVGAAIGAALIAFLLAFLIFRRKRPRSEAGAFVSEKSTPSHPWDAFLPQSADDGKVSTAMQTLCSQIDMHVENYYGNNFQPALFERSRGYLGMVDSGKLQGSVEQLLPEVQLPLPIIKHCFTWFILGKLAPAVSPEETLLPAEYARFPGRLASSRGRRGEDQAAAQAYNYWRVLTTYLLYPNGTQNTSQTQGLSPTATHTIDVLTAAFAPWAKTAKGGQEHLGSVLRSASNTGLLVLSQPSSFAFEWDVLRRDDGTSVVVTPAFEKTADEHGAALSQRQRLVKPKVEPI